MDTTKVFISDEYKLDPDSVNFMEEFVEINSLYNEAEYIATKGSIERNGQINPIFMMNGLCVDGRHRTKICKELGIEVKAIDLRRDLSPKEVAELANLYTTTGRQLNATQRAILAYNMMLKFNLTQRVACEEYQTNRQMLAMCVYIDNNSEAGILQALFEDKAVQLSNMDKASKSLSFVCKKLKELGEVKVTEKESTIEFNPESQIKTEVGKAWYYKTVTEESIPTTAVNLRIILAEYANLKFEEVEA